MGTQLHRSTLSALCVENMNGMVEPTTDNNDFGHPICQELKSWGADLNSANEDGIFNMFKDENDCIVIAKFLAALGACGLRRNDPRLQRMLENFRKIQHQKLLNGDKDAYNLGLSKENFRACLCDCNDLISRALRLELVIPDWPSFCEQVDIIYENCKSIEDGKVADYIPQLARCDPNKWGVAICTIDGQRAVWGDSSAHWSLQSISKAFTYGIALDVLGDKVVHSYVGQEPSGRLFNDISLNSNNRPHNPMINAGSIVVLSLLKPDMYLSDRFEFLINMFRKISGNGHIGFSNSTYLSERATADRNFALAYFMREHKCFPKNVNLNELLDFYFQVCSIETTCESAAVMAATLANGGVCPLTGEVTLKNQSVRDVLSLMYSCGMYDYSGQFAFRVGLPAKSAVSGGMILVVPNVMGIAMYSPPLDHTGNTVRGVNFSKQLVQRFNFHNYDSLVHGISDKIDPRKPIYETVTPSRSDIFYAAANGDLHALKCFFLQGVKMNIRNYDDRTPLHVAASEGREEVVEFLIKYCKVKLEPRDRWNHTPLDNAKQFNHMTCVRLLESALEEKAEPLLDGSPIAITVNPDAARVD